MLTFPQLICCRIKKMPDTPCGGKFDFYQTDFSTVEMCWGRRCLHFDIYLPHRIHLESSSRLIRIIQSHENRRNKS